MTMIISAGAIPLWILGAIIAYYVLLPLLIACGHCAILVLWKPPKNILLEVKRQFRHRRLSDIAFYLALGALLTAMVSVNLPEREGRSDEPPPEGHTGRHSSGGDDSNDKEYYDLLGLPPGASWEDIKKAYHALSLEWHPDKHPPHKHIHVKTVFMQITEAYEYFKNRQ